MKLHQIVGPHDPDEPVLRIALQQGRNRINREPGSHFLFDIGRVNAGVSGGGGGGGEPVSQRCHPGYFLKWILRADQPPDRIESQPPHRLDTDMTVTGVRRIERSAEQADVHGLRSRDWNRPENWAGR